MSALHASVIHETPAAPEPKARDAFKTISEVSAELGVPQHVLRFWESRFSQIRPMKLKGGRRYYRPEDVVVLRRIKALLYSQGYTIKGARKLVNLREVLTPEPVAAVLPPLPEEKLLPVKVEPAPKAELLTVLEDLYRLRDTLKMLVQKA